MLVSRLGNPTFRKYFEIFGLVFSLARLVSLTKRTSTNQTKLLFLRKGAVFQPSDLMDSLAKWSQDKSLSESIKIIKETAGSILFNGFIEGQIAAKTEGIPAKFTKADLAVQSISKFYTRSNDHFRKEGVQNRPFLNKFNILLNIFLQNTKNGKTHQCEIRNIHEVDLKHGLVYLGSGSKTKNLGKIERVIRLALYVLQILIGASRLGLHLNGIKTGVKQSEYGIKLGDNRTIYGEFLYSKDSDKLQMLHPKDIFTDRLAFIREMEKKVVLDLLQTFLWSLTVGLFLVPILKRLLVFLRRRSDQKTQTQDKLRSLRKIETEDFKCSLCNVNPRNIILKPCWHFSICDSCWKNKEGLNAACPQCKKTVNESIQVFTG